MRSYLTVKYFYAILKIKKRVIVVNTKEAEKLCTIQNSGKALIWGCCEHEEGFMFSVYHKMFSRRVVHFYVKDYNVYIQRIVFKGDRRERTEIVEEALACSSENFSGVVDFVIKMLKEVYPAEVKV